MELMIVVSAIVMVRKSKIQRPRRICELPYSTHWRADELSPPINPHSHTFTNVNRRCTINKDEVHLSYKNGNSKPKGSAERCVLVIVV